MRSPTSLAPEPQGSADSSDAHAWLSAHALTLARSACAAIAALVIILDVVSIPAAYRLVVTPCSPCDPNSIQVTTMQAKSLASSGFNIHVYALCLVGIIVITETVYIGLGVLLLVRRSSDRMALFTALTLITFGGAAFTGTMHALSSVNLALWEVIFALNIIGQSTFITFLFVFPTGAFVPRWTVLPATIWTLSWGIQIFRNPTLDKIASTLSDGPLFLVVILLLIIVQVYRYRRVSTPAQRQQTKWVVYGVALGLTGFASTITLGNVILPSNIVDAAIPSLISSAVVYLCFLLIPIAIAFAILRSRLYDIDILINRTLVYGSLTLILAGLYFGMVVGAQVFTRQIIGQYTPEPPLVIVLSTLLIAALAQPLRRRLQRTIDRRFYRSRYDAAKTVDAFSALLRNEVELGTLSEQLVTVVEETMRPSHVSLWLMPSTSHSDPPTRDV